MVISESLKSAVGGGSGRPFDHLSAVIRNLREPVLVIGENMRVAAANRAAIGIFKPHSDRILNLRLSEVIRDISIHEVFNGALFDNESSQVKLEIRVAEIRTYDVSVTPLELDQNKLAIAVFNDTTRINHLEKIRREFLSNVSHELRTPLTSILAFVETLENGGIEDKENNRRFLGIIGKNAERMQHLINDLSELSSIEAGIIEIRQSEIDLTQLVSDVFASLSVSAKERNILLINNIAQDALVYADPMKMGQMLTNLIDNSIKFNRRDGKVTVRLDATETSHVISVSDTGEGITSEQLPRIFERLYRVDRGRAREIGGTGLGLAIVKHLARIHHGEVRVTSIPGEGSTFILEIPKNTKA